MPRQFIILMTDTQRADMVGCYGNAAMQTPSLDRLAASGTRFDKAYTCQPVCGPARAGLFTGIWPHGNNGWANSMGLDANCRTLGMRFAAAGFHTGYIGKWHLDGGDYFGAGTCPPGWDPAYWYDMRNYLDELTPEERQRSRQTRVVHEGYGVDEAFCFGHRCSDRAIRFLERHRDEDFLLVVSYDEPHGPFLCPQRFIDLHRDTAIPKSRNLWDDLESKPEHQRVWAEEARVPPPEVGAISAPEYFGCNSYVDYEIGRVLEAVDVHAAGAFVLYTSDHGDHLRSHRLTNKGPTMYEENTRIPYLVRWPGRVPAGTACGAPVSHIDVVPTLLAAAGLEVPKPLHGRSVLATLQDPENAPIEPVFMEFGRYEIDHDGFGGFQPVRCVFDGRTKLVINLLSSDELYDLETDPEELTNRIEDASLAELRNALHDRLLAWMNETRDPFRGYYWERRPWRSDASPASWAHTGYTRQREAEPGENRQLDYDTGLPMAAATRPK